MDKKSKIFKRACIEEDLLRLVLFFFTGFQGEDFLQLIQVLQNKFKLKDRAFQMNNNNNKYDQYLQLPWSPMSCADYKNMYFVRSCFGTNEPLTSLTLCPHFFFQISADLDNK